MRTASGGIPVPNSMEYDAAREIAANMGNLHER